MAWLMMLPFFLLFVANNYLLVPYLLFRKKYVAYASSLLVIIVLLFGIYPHLARPPYDNRFKQQNRPPMEQRMPEEHSFTKHPAMQEPFLQGEDSASSMQHPSERNDRADKGRGPRDRMERRAPMILTYMLLFLCRDLRLYVWLWPSYWSVSISPSN